jgi:hypothetical protein
VRGRERTKTIKAPSTERWVKLRAVFGVDAVPEDVAALLRAVVDALVESGDVPESARWRALEFVVADFVAGWPGRMVPDDDSEGPDERAGRP